VATLRLDARYASLMAFRNDDVAARARIEALEGEVERLREENEALIRGDAPIEDAPERPRGLSSIPGLLTVMLGMTVLAGAYYYGSRIESANGQLGAVLMVAGTTIVTLGAGLWVAARQLVIVPPGEIAVLSGRRYVDGGVQRGYRVVSGGRALRLPIVETVAFMSTRPHSIECMVRGAYDKMATPVDVEIFARVKVAHTAPVVHAAVERFLGRDREDIARAARETLEGDCRAVIALHTGEEMRMDVEKLAMLIIEESEGDLRKLGIEIDSLKAISV